MNTIQIERQMALCEEGKGIFKGVYASDELPVYDLKPYAFIANVDARKYSGSHWVSFYVDNDNVEFFDSYGRSPYSNMFPISFQNYVSNKVCFYNTRVLEGFFDNTCAHFSIYMICLRLKGLSFSEIVNSFSVDVDYNHYIVLNFFK